MFKVYSTVNELPAAWDDMLKENIFLNRKSLMNLAILNSCHQTYHMDEENRIAFVAYKINISLFTFSKNLSLKVPIDIIGVPMSVSECGYFAEDEEARLKMVSHIKSLEGFQVILNAEDDLSLPQGTNLPKCKINVEWSTMEEYLSRLRSNYRYRVKKAIKRFAGIEIEEIRNNCSFDQDMYELYEEVYNNSNTRLEKLDISFFKNYPSKIFKFTLQGKPVAFIQLVENKDELIFLFSGFKHELNKKYDLYFNMLLKVLEYGIEKGFKYINLGQTSEETKLKLGAQQYKKLMYVHHNNPLINFFIKLLVKGFSCKEYDIVHRVFKE
jgi:hypothetical protein